LIRTRAAASDSAVHALRRILVVALTIGAVLFGLLALHSVAGSPEGMPTIASAAAQLQAAGDGSDAGRPAAVSAQQQGTDLLLLDNDQGRALGCALIAMICAVLATLIGMIVLARQPALFNQLVDGIRGMIQRAPVARNFAYLPSLIVLSISRT